jgi:hypothetical protein
MLFRVLWRLAKRLFGGGRSAQEGATGMTVAHVPPPLPNADPARDVYVVSPDDGVHVPRQVDAPASPATPPPPPPDPNRVESAIGEAVKSAGLRPMPEVIETSLKKFVVDDLSDAEREAWFYFRALAAFSRGDAHEAFRRAESGLRMNGDSSRLRIALADMHERNGNRERMFELLDTMPHPKEHGRIQMTAARYAWYCDDLERATAYVQPVLEAFYEMSDGDDATLYSRGLPFVRDVLYFVAAVHALRGDLAPARRVVAETHERMSNVDLADVMLFLDCKATNDFRPVLEARERDDSLAFSGGIIPTQMGVIRAQLTADPNAAVELLRRIVLPRQHVPWLNDVILLAVCQLAGRAGNEPEESRLRADFVRRQPMLLEPNHAMYFNLLEYQESLKPAAQAARRYA